MKLLPKLPRLVSIIFSIFPLLLAGQSALAEGDSLVRSIFKDPPREYSTGPLWVWNDMLTDEQVRGTLRDLAGQKIKQVWVHPRPGLMTPYLSPEWFRLWKLALKEAKRLDMNVWIYDENSYPSGFAGGWVPEVMPESRGRGLVLKESRAAPKASEPLIGLYRFDDTGSFQNITTQFRSGESLPDARYLVATEVRAGNSPWHGNRSYVNLLSPGVTEKFLELTLEPYRREVGAEFGKHVPGVFTDEPNIRPAGGFPWSEILVSEFKKRWGYDLLDHLPSLSQKVGDWRKARHNYLQVLHEQFVEHWAKPYHDYCETNHLKLTGHYWDHEWPNCLGVPDNMAMYSWHQLPAIDCLMNQYAEHTHAQFGNVRMVKELSSVANQLGTTQTLCEIYGAGGWDLRFEDMKRIGDWLEVLGVNVLNQHLSYVTIRGARKRDHPQSFSYHAPWFGAYHVSAEYLARVSAALTQGEQVNRVLVLEPTTTAWMYQGEAAKLTRLGDYFFKLLMGLESAQIEYDLASEDIIARYGRSEGSSLVIGNRTYQIVLVPPFMENWNSRTKELLQNVAMHRPAGTLGKVDGSGTDSSEASEEFILKNWDSVLNSYLADVSVAKLSQTVYVERSPSDPGILFHHRRQLKDGELLFLVNTSISNSSSGVVVSRLGAVERWNPYDGKIAPFPFAKLDRVISAKFDLPPSGSLLLYFSKEPSAPRFPHQIIHTITPMGPVNVERLEPNVLTLDFVDVSAGGESRAKTYFYQANQFIWKKNGMDRDPWDSAVQFKDELVSKKFGPDTGFEATYNFTIEDRVPEDLCIVIERPDLYTITCNGEPVKARKGQWWLDKAFGRIPIASAARPGANAVHLKASPFTMLHELEPAYLLGDFSLKPTASGFVVTASQPLAIGNSSDQARTGWNQQGHPFYSAGVAYSEQFQVDKLGGRFVLSATNWYGSVAKVVVNGKLAGYIDAPPWECDITKSLKRGLNSVQLTVIGTPKNLLGPHHGNPGLGSAWPGSFQRGPDSGPSPGDAYSTVAYGLFSPFVLKQTVAEAPSSVASRGF